MEARLTSCFSSSTIVFMCMLRMLGWYAKSSVNEP